VEPGHHLFGGEVADEGVAGEGAAAEPAQRPLDVPHPALERDLEERRPRAGPGVEVEAEALGSVAGVEHRRDVRGARPADGVGDDHALEAHRPGALDRRRGDASVPRLPVGIAEAHREVDDREPPRRHGALAEGPEPLPRVLEAAAGVAPLEALGERERETERPDLVDLEGPIDPTVVDDDGEELAPRRQGEVGEHGRAVGELRHRTGRDERARVEVRQPRLGAADEELAPPAEVERGRQRLPGVTGALDVTQALHDGSIREPLGSGRPGRAPSPPGRILEGVLRTIELRDFAIADAVDVPLRPGLNVLTGETGAGKSLVVDALALASGGRADVGVIRSGADSALVQLHFTDGAPVASAGRRIVTEGRNVARLDGEVVTVGELQEALDAVIGIFGQHAFRTLLEGDQQRRALDRLLGDDERLALEHYREAHAAVLVAEAALTLHRTGSEARERRIDLLRHAREELAAADLREGESEALDDRLGLLRQVEAVVEGVGGAFHALAGRERAAVDRMAEALRALDGASRHAASLRALGDDLRVALDGVQAVATELEAFLDDVDRDPRSLAEAEARRALLDRLFAKYGGDEAEALSALERARSELERLEGEDADAASIEADLASARARRSAAGATLSTARAEAAARLGPAVSATLASLALPDARFTVALEPLPHPGPHGLERVEFRFGANPGESEGPLSSVASGGELSRVMLALHAVAGTERPVLAFDEVDAGVGGRTGRAVGRLLKSLSLGRQVLVVTHLAQIAAYADHHLHVDKVTVGGRTMARVRPVEGEERLRELARMLAGDDGPEALQHARTLLSP
jgi:DNA repair protein RecN (Recombination protein N)